ncbi:hypothetical protein JSE7799_02912 [Jannaschia seosinensis]|uniref:Uncharacterized protein n=1 Tax=Jannaschia seosinensis TaxID=313367 RepID=A0A0M7BEH0_9RHOB|nr:hypothetical protein [Jannaschia seosinensis]CUH40182.1 hypothetical protein JSE7799_02912 [Jannaschia seosinensis]
MAEIQIFGDGAVTVVLVAEISASSARVTGLIVRLAGNEATVTLAEAIENIHVKLLFFENEDGKFGPPRDELPSIKEAAALGLAAARAKLRAELASVEIREKGIFGFPAGFAKASMSIRFADSADGSLGFRLDARTRLDVSAQFALEQYAMVTANAELEARITVASEDVLASLELLVPTLPNLGFKLRDVALPTLSFYDLNGVDIKIGSLTALKLPLPEWLPNISVEGGAPFTVSADAGNGAFGLNATTDIDVLLDSNEIAKIEDFAISLDGGTIKVAGKVTAEHDTPINKRFEFGGGDLPVRVQVAVKNVTAAFDGGAGALAVTWTFEEIAVEATDDPGARIAVALDLVTVTTLSSGETSWDAANAKLLDLGADVTFEVPDLNIIDGLMNLRLGFLADAAGALAEFLDRLARLLAAVLRYMARAVGAVTGLLSEVAKALAGLLADGLRKLLELLDKVGDVVTLELRLDAATLRPLQVVVLPVNADPKPVDIGSSLLRVTADHRFVPGMILDFVNHWQGLALLREPDLNVNPQVTISTDLWLGSDTDEAGTIPVESPDPLISVSATAKDPNAAEAIVIAALSRGRGKFFQTFGAERKKAEKNKNGVITFTSVGAISDLKALSTDNFLFKLDAERLKNKITALMPQGPPESGSDKLAQFIDIEEFTFDPDSAPKFKGNLKVRIRIPTTGNNEILIPLEISAVLDIETLELTLDADEEIIIQSKAIDEVIYGFGLILAPVGYDKDKTVVGDLFKIGFKKGDLSLELAAGAKALLSYDQLSGDGASLAFEATEFAIDRGGLDLIARVMADRPVRLGGLDQPFRFNRGSISIQGGVLQGGTISGYGPMPPALIGEAKAEIDLVFGRRNGNLALVAANAKLEKEGEPLYSTGTRFRVVLDALGLGFVDPVVGPTQFYFQLWGSASFEPEIGAFDGGLLENLKSVAIRLEGAPLTGDGRELIKHISFLVELDPPLREKLFEIFKFEIRGIAFYPASKAWPDNPPAIGIAGQISFLEAGDVVSSEISFHEILIALPEPGGDLPLPRIRADGLSMLLRIGGVAQVEATALAVDGSIPSLYAPVALPADVTAKGFLASGRIDIVGLGAFGGAMGVLELKKNNQVKHAMFIYGQAEKLTERIDTPIGPLFIREVGFGFGKNYTLSALAGADEAKTPRELVTTLDRLSKVQGNLTNFNAWTPQFDKDALTLALRGMISVAATSTSSASYDADGEAKVSNPLLMDIVLALRTDLTFFVNVRGWLATNYNDWFIAPSGAEFKERPTLRGYLYFSVPRKEFLARFLSDPTGIVGKHPELPDALVKAIEGTRFAATLYIRPGLYHTELGWPYELGFELGKPTDNFYLSLSAGLVFRIEDATMLYGVAFKASGLMQFGGEVGNANFGASATARADFLLGARFIAYLAPLNPRDTLFYGEVYLGLTLKFSVSVWLSFKVFRKRFTLRIGFSIGLTIEIAAEVVLSGQGLGARVYASVGVQGFGRSLSVGVGFSFGDSALDRARGRVARFMQLGLGIDPPREETLLAPAPAAEPARSERAKEADRSISERHPPQPPNAPLPDPVTVEPAKGRQIEGTDFWAVLLHAGKDPNGEDTYLIQLIPRDHSERVRDTATFYAEPWFIKDQKEGAKTAGATKGRTEGDYKIKLTTDIDGLKYFGRLAEGDPKAPATLTAIKKDVELQLFANLARPVGETENGDLDLNFLLTECFLAHPDSVPGELAEFGFGESLPVQHTHPDAFVDIPPRQSRDNQAQRFAATDPVLEASVIAEEKRSALINKIGESAFALAERARDRSGAEDAVRLVQETETLNAVDFGLTFLLKASNLDLFEKDGKARLELYKRVGDYSAGNEPDWDFVKCSVELLNHPDESFEATEPRLDDARVELADDGYRLYWDLEPAFGSSAELGFAKDPETRLAFYEIERSFEGADIAMTAQFRTKSATPQQHNFDPVTNTVVVSRSRAALHLTDDLSQGGVPEALRAQLFGTPLPKGASARAIWTAAFGASPQASVVYKVTAVDVLGTRTGLRVLERTIARPPLDVRPPLSVELAVSFEGELPKLQQDADPQIDLTLIYEDVEHFAAAQDQPLQLRVRSHTLLGGGEYGADAVDDAKSRPGQADIDTKRERDVDLFLVPDGGGALKVKLGLAEGASSKGLPKDRRYNLTLVPNGTAVADPALELRRALHIPKTAGTAQDLRACRAFLRSFGKLYIDPTPWLYVETLLRAEKTVPQADSVEEVREFAAVVEALETPLSLPFLALEQNQIERNAGRLELVYPVEGAELKHLAEQAGPVVTRRRLDPERRAAIRLDFNASGARLAKASGTRLASLVAGYDVFVVDPARLRSLGGKDGPTADQVAAEARKRTTVKVLPRTLAGTSPSALPDTRSIEVRYPSDTARTDPEQLNGRTHAPWFSAAESLVAFPRRCLRRSLFPAPEEAMISELLAERKVRKIDFALTPLPGGLPDEPLSRAKWLANAPVEVKRDIAHPNAEKPAPKVKATAESDGDIITWTYESDDDITVAEVRAILRGLVIQPDEVVEDAYRAWRASGSNPGLANQFRLRVAITATDDQGSAAESHTEVDLASSLHPVLADTLDALNYMPYDEKTAGAVYRAFEVVREPVPPLETDGLDTFLDARAPSADPYGWGVLRAMGLAEGVRIYDVDRAQFLKGQALFDHVDRVLTEALKRYDVAPLGHPFVELVDVPDDFMGISSFDGRAEAPAEDTQRIRAGDTSILQIGLRPHADRLSVPEPPVRYLVCSRVDDKALAPEKLTFPADQGSALIDTVGLPLEQGAGAARFAVGNASSIVFPGQPELRIPGGAQIYYDRLSRLVKGRPAVLIRVAAVETGFKFGAFRDALQQAIDPARLTISPWIDTLDDWTDTRDKEGTLGGNPFDVFPPLDGALLRVMLDLPIAGSSDETQASRFKSWLPPRHNPANDSAAFDATAFAARFGAWSERFLRHGAAIKGRGAATSHIGFAFAALTTGESYARTPDQNGRVSVFMIDQSRLGRERYFAIRPFGRYVSIEQAANGGGERPVTLEGALHTDWQRQFASVSLPRSKPLDPPAILSTARAESDEIRQTRGVELVVARTADQIVSTANLRAERALQGAWTGLELRASYPALDIARALLGNKDFEAFEDFDDCDFGADTMKPGDMSIMTPEDLARLGERAPDAWRGAIRYEVAGAPPFFDLIAMVHQSAGVVVSDVSAVPLPSSGAVLRLPPREKGGGVRHHVPAKVPTWRFDYVEDDGTLKAQVTFDLPMVRNIDLMPDVDITAWTGDDPAKVATVYRLPDAQASYRISTLAPDLATATPLIEVLPAQEVKNPLASLYHPMLLSNSFDAVAKTVTLSGQKPEPYWNWRLRLTATLPSGKAPEEIHLPDPTADGKGGFTNLPTDFDAEVWLLWAPQRTFEFIVEDLDGVADLVSALTAYDDVPGVAKMITDLTAAGEGDKITAALPLGLAPDVSGVTGAGATEGAFTFPDKLEAGIPVSAARRSRGWAEHLPGKTRDLVNRIMRALGELRRRQLPTGKSGLTAVYRRTEVSSKISGLAAPYAHFRLLRYKADDGTGITDSQLLTLIDALEAAPSSDERIRARALDTLELAQTPAAEVTIVWPVADKAVAVKDLTSAAVSDSIFAGVHWLPDRAEQDNVPAKIKDIVRGAIRERVIGEGARLRLSAYRGNAQADTALIDLTLGTE